MAAPSPDAESEPLAYKNETYHFIVFSRNQFFTDSVVDSPTRAAILRRIVTLCARGVTETYIYDELNNDPDMHTHGWIGVLIDTPPLHRDADMNVDLIGVIAFKDMRPEKPDVFRTFVCGEGVGSVINTLFEQHIRAVGSVPVTVHLRSINVPKVTESHMKNGYVKTGVEKYKLKEGETEEDIDDTLDLILMSKVIEGGRRRRKQILLTYRRRYGRNERSPLRRKARRTARTRFV